MEKKTKPDIREMALKKGMDFPNDEELLMLILGTGSKDCPVQNLARMVNDVIDSSPSEILLENLSRVKGMGDSRILQVAAAVELGRRKSRCSGIRIRRASDLVPYIKSYSMKSREHFLCVTLKGNHEVIQVNVVSVGTVNSSLIYPREVIETALKDNAASIIVCHNHPSGNLNPSNSDIETTERLISAFNVMGIPILDHLIITTKGYYSFREQGLLFTED